MSKKAKSATPVQRESGIELLKILAIFFVVISHVCQSVGQKPAQLPDLYPKLINLSAATENILLRATDLGLGAVWCGIYPQKRAVEKVKELLNLEDNLIPLNIIYIGYPALDVEARDQYDENKVHYIK